MDEYILNAIDIRKKSISEYYEVKDSKILAEIDQLFSEINNLGALSKDVSDFEDKFANSELNNKYMDLLTKISLNCPLKSDYKEKAFEKEDVKDYLKQEVKEEAEYIAKTGAFNAASAVDRELGVTEKIRDTPILGDAYNLEHQTGILSGIANSLFRKRNKNKKNIEEIEELEEENEED